MAELADAHGSGPCESNFMEVQVLLAAPRRNGLCSVPIFLCRKISYTLRRSSFFVKSHAQFACSFVNALATAHNRYQLFTILCLRRSQNPLSLLRLRASPVRTLAPRRNGLCSVPIFFYLWYNNLTALPKSKILTPERTFYHITSQQHSCAAFLM